MTRMPYSASDYWSSLHARDDLSAVGQSGLSPSINAWLYRVLARNLRSFVGRHGLTKRPPATVFEIGAGTGYWVDVWRSIGARRVDGCDLVPAAVERLQERHGAAGTFTVADITDRATLPDTTYDLVTATNVLLHITADDAFDRALTNIAALVASGGFVLLTEPILLDPSYAKPYDAEAASRARPLRTYAAPLEAAGLELVDVKPAIVLANNPIEARSKTALKRYQRWWRYVVTRSREAGFRSRLIGPALWVAEPVAIRTGQAPSSKFALFRRPEAAS
jgi:SAM-dependent methyltransferase